MFCNIDRNRSTKKLELQKKWVDWSFNFEGVYHPSNIFQFEWVYLWSSASRQVCRIAVLGRCRLLHQMSEACVGEPAGGRVESVELLFMMREQNRSHPKSQLIFYHCVFPNLMKIFERHLWIFYKNSNILKGLKKKSGFFALVEFPFDSQMLGAGFPKCWQKSMVKQGVIWNYKPPL